MLYTLSGAPREAFAQLPDAAQHARCSSRRSAARASSARTTSRRTRATARTPPYYGMPQGHLPVRSYLAVPVVSRSGEVLGGLFFGHSDAGVFTERDRDWSSAASPPRRRSRIDNARLYQAASGAERREPRSLRQLNDTPGTAGGGARSPSGMRAEEALRQAQKMEAVGQLTGGVAHDFNNLLTVILGNLEIAAAPAATGHAQRRAHPARRRAMRRRAARGGADAAAARLLAAAAARPEAARCQPAGRAACRTCCAARWASRSRSRPCSRAGCGAVVVDPNQLENALLNLAVNARDAMPEGGKLTIETANAHLDEAYARAAPGGDGRANTW